MSALGRRPLDAGQKKSAYIGVAVTPSMYEQLQKEARAAGYSSLSAFIRERKLAATIRVED